MRTLHDRLAHIVPGLEEGTSKAESGAAEVGQRAQQVRHNRVFQRFARLGLLQRAVVYFLLGALILEIAARGRASARADSEGAFADIARQPAGTEILVLVAVGLAAYAVWRFVETLSSTPQGQKASGWVRIGWVGTGALYLILCADVIRMAVGSGQNGGPEQHPSSLAGDILRLPLGRELLGLIAAATAAGGLALIAWGVRHDYGRFLHTTKMRPRTVTVVRVSGAFGNAARGFAVLLIASSLFASAFSDNPTRAKSLDAALKGLAGSPVGVLLLVMVGAGFLSFCLHSTIEARFRRM